MKHTLRSAVSGVAVIAALTLPVAAAQAHPNIYQAGIRVAFTPEVQTLTLSNSGAAATVDDATVANGPSPAAYATAAQIQTILNADPKLGYNGVGVSGPDGGPFKLTFQGNAYGFNTDGVTLKVPISSSTIGADAQAGVNVDQIAATGGASVTSQDGGTPVTATTDATGLAMAQKANSYAISNDGYEIGVVETNGVGPAANFASSNRGGGMIALASGLSDRKTYASKADWLTVPSAETSIQLHATCQGVTALQTQANILAAWGVQNINSPSTGGTDPFYDYIPWQGTNAVTGTGPTPLSGTLFGDTPSVPTWIAEIKALFPANAAVQALSTTSSTSDWTAACTSVGGTYTPADTLASQTGSLVTDSIAPYTAQVTSLTADKATLVGSNASLTSSNASLTTDKAALQAKSDSLSTANGGLVAQVAQLQSMLASLGGSQTTLQSELAAALNRPLDVSSASKHVSLSAPAVMVSGKASTEVKVTLTVTTKVRKAAGLPSTTLGTGEVTLGTSGASFVNVKPGKGVVKALAARKGAVTATLTAAAGTETDTATVSVDN